MNLTTLAGGVGAAKLLSGLAALLPPENLTAIVNTGDDFRWMGLHICPDLDTVTYTLAGIASLETGWGVQNDTFNCLQRLHQLGCEPWFLVGDRDLATHIYRTSRLQNGASLTEVAQDICRQNGVIARLLPMTDRWVPTIVDTEEGTFAFQDYFVRRKCTPRVRGFFFEGIESAVPAPGVLEAILGADAILVCPSNPFISIGPILAVPGISQALQATKARVVAVSPIVSGDALKGPAAAMMSQLGHEVSAVGVARLYRDFLDLFVLDARDENMREPIEELGIEAHAMDIVMNSMASRAALARSILEFLS